MLKVGTPPNPDNFVLVKDWRKILELHENGFLPSYKGFEGVYFKATPEIFKILR